MSHRANKAGGVESFTLLREPPPLHFVPLVPLEEGQFFKLALLLLSTRLLVFNSLSGVLLDSCALSF